MPSVFWLEVLLLFPQLSKPLRIALLGYRSHPHVGGQGIYLHYLSKALVELGHQVDVISGPPYPELDSRVRLIQLPSLDLYAHPHPTFALKFKHLFSWADFYEWWSKLTGAFGEPYCFGRRLVKFFQKNPMPYDIIHDNQSLCYGLLDVQKRFQNLVVTIHHPVTRDHELAIAAAVTKNQRILINRWYSFISMQKKVVKQLQHIITVSKQSKQDIQQAFACDAEKITVIGCGVDTNIFRPQENIKRLKFRLITTASSDQPLKGLSILLNAIANIKTEFPELQLIVIGQLKEDGDTEKELEKLQLQNIVEFKSGISTEELVQEYAKASLAIVPSLYEGFGLPAAEALACGTPLISSDGGALPEVVGDAAYLVKAGNVDNLTKAIRDLLNDGNLRQAFSEKGRQHSLQQLSWEKVAGEMVAYYQDRILRKN
jgi:glycosyltransferase involved in cell wall biosynthesis